MARAQIEQCVDRRVRQRARGIRLHRDAGGDQLPAAAEPVEGVGGQRRARERRDVTLATVERAVGRRHALTGELRGAQSALRRVARVIGLRHRAEVFLEPGGERGRDAERVARLRHVQAKQSRRRGGAAQRADGRRRVPSARVVCRVQRDAERRVDLKSNDVGQRERRAVGGLRLGRRQRGGEQRDARMAHQREVRVVEVVRVAGGAVGQRGPAGRGAHRCAEHGAESHAAFDAGDGAHALRDRLRRAREHDADRVEDGAARLREHGVGTLTQGRLDDELGEAGGGGHGTHDSGGSRRLQAAHE